MLDPQRIYIEEASLPTMKNGKYGKMALNKLIDLGLIQNMKGELRYFSHSWGWVTFAEMNDSYLKTFTPGIIVNIAIKLLKSEAARQAAATTKKAA